MVRTRAVKQRMQVIQDLLVRNPLGLTHSQVEIEMMVDTQDAVMSRMNVWHSLQNLIVDHPDKFRRMGSLYVYVPTEQHWTNFENQILSELKTHLEIIEESMSAIRTILKFGANSEE